MAEQAGTTALARTEDGSLDLSHYKRAEVNLLTPVLRYDSSAPWLHFRAVEIRLDPDHEQGDCYPAPGSRWDGPRERRVPAIVAPAKTALLKIASAVGLVQDPDRSGRIRPDACERCIELASHHKQAVQCGTCPARYDTAYRIVGAVRADTGWRTLQATYEWSYDAQERKLRLEAKKKAKAAARKNPPEEFDEEEHVQNRMDQIVPERFGLAETKALLRLIRAICNVPHTFRRQAFARPFIVVRADLVPDVQDPAARSALLDRAREATASVYPTSGDPAERALADKPTFEHPEDVGGADNEPIDAEAGAADEDAGEHEHQAQPEDAPTICPGCEEIITAARLEYLKSAAAKTAMEKYVPIFGTGEICYKCQQQGDAAIKREASR